MIIKFNKIAKTLGSRRLGKKIREEIEKNLVEHEIIVFDFEGVELVSNSFADECFGKLVEEIGLDKIKRKTTFKSVNKDVGVIIKKAITDRLDSMCIV